MGGFDPILVIGAGKMGGAIMRCWLEAEAQAAGSGVASTSLFVEDPYPAPDIRAYLSSRNVEIATDASMALPPALVMVAVKPQIMGDVLDALAPRLGSGSLVLSIAAGKSLDDLAQALPDNTAVVRMMPNTPVALGKGMSVLVANRHVGADQRERVNQLMAATGAVSWIEDEALMDAVTAVSGSGPAYVFLLAECLQKAGIKAGLDKDLALLLARQTIYGAGALMAHEPLDPSQLRENVTSKGGTTAAALAVLMDDDRLARLIEEAISAAAARSRALSSV